MTIELFNAETIAAQQKSVGDKMVRAFCANCDGVGVGSVGVDASGVADDVLMLAPV